jgi:hypothetical protein
VIIISSSCSAADIFGRSAHPIIIIIIIIIIISSSHSADIFGRSAQPSRRKWKRTSQLLQERAGQF